jgi:hypothetical protein
MVATIETICNRALQKIGAQTFIVSIDEGSAEAKQLKLIFDDTVDELLGMAWWNFARKTVALTLNKSAPGTPENLTAPTTLWTNAYPAPPWLYEYLLPSDCNMARYVLPQPTGQNARDLYQSNYSGIKFSITAGLSGSTNVKVLNTNAQNALLVYTFENPTIATWSALFIEALAAVLAAKSVYAITGNAELSTMLFKQANNRVMDARADDGNEGITILDPPVDWIQIRSGGGSAIAAALPGVPNYNPLYSI